MIFSDLPSPAEADLTRLSQGLASRRRKTGIHPRIKSEGVLFPDHALKATIMNTPRLGDFRRIVVKVGSSLLVDAAAGRLNESWLAALTADLAPLHRDKRDVIVVSSGAIALGRAVLKLPAGPLKLEDGQAAAAVGQIALARTWAEALSRHDITAGQVLVTLGDTEERRGYLTPPR